jgi:hypothetical protein
MGAESLYAQVAEAFVEAASINGAPEDEEDILFAYLAQQRREQKAEKAQEWRLNRRLKRQHREVRACPVCNKKFEVVLHQRPGRVREYCCWKHTLVAVKRRSRGSQSSTTAQLWLPFEAFVVENGCHSFGVDTEGADICKDVSQPCRSPISRDVGEAPLPPKHVVHSAS